MKQSQWSEEDRVEYAQMMDQVCDESARPGERAKLLRERVRDAIQAQRVWAYEVEEAALLDGLRKAANGWAQRRRSVSTKRGKRTITRSAIAGARSHDAGRISYVQQELDLFSREQHREARSAAIANAQAYSDRAAIHDAYLALLDAAPGAATAREAAAQLDTTVEAWLLGDAA